jgi:hypothetical protein
MKRIDIIEISFLKSDDSGITSDQILELDQILYDRCIVTENIHCYVLDNLLKYDNIRHKITYWDANKLIKNLRAGRPFTFVVYNTKEYWKLKDEDQ